MEDRVPEMKEMHRQNPRDLKRPLEYPAKYNKHAGVRKPPKARDF